MKLSEMIQNYRTEHNISQRQLASNCGLSSGYISLIEKEYNPQTGKKMIPSIAILNKLAKGMGITLDELFSICDDMPVTLSPETKLVDSVEETEKAPTYVAEDSLTEEERSVLSKYNMLTDTNRIRIVERMDMLLEEQQKLFRKNA